MMRTIKLIGGPLDGQLTQVPLLGDRYRVPMLSDPNILAKLATVERSTEPMEVTVMEYRRREIMGVEIWAPAGMRDPQIIELLVQRYGR